MAKYKLTTNGVYDNEREIEIPNNEKNRHWKEYQQWLAEDNIPDPIDPEPEPVTDQLSAMINNIQTINDVKEYLLFTIGAT